MDRVIAFGDIHGCSAALSSAVHAIRPTQDDMLVVLGDFIDYGLDSRGVLDQLIDLERSCRLVSLLGNHEEMMLSARQGRKAKEFWLNCGGIATLESYGFGAQLAHIPARHWQFLEHCLPFFETRTHLFVHANYRPRLPLTKQQGEMLRWRSLDDFLPDPHVSGKVAVVGHTPQSTGAVLNLGHLLCIDTFVQGGGWLTALDVTSGEVWQVNEQGQLRGNASGLLKLRYDDLSGVEIDPLLRELIAELNAVGFKTFCSCQGKTSEQDFKDMRHCDHAFVTFSAALIRKVAAKARKLGLYISFRNRFITSLGGDEKDNGEIIAKNLNFPARMRELFELPSTYSCGSAFPKSQCPCPCSAAQRQLRADAGSRDDEGDCEEQDDG